MKNHFKDFVDILFPVCCPGCGQPLTSVENTICISCLADLPIFKNEINIETILGGRVEIKTGAIYLKFYSQGIVQALLHDIKYKNNKVLGELLGEKFMLFDKTYSRLINTDIIVPIPLHENKLRQRGYNQSEVIANGIARVLPRPIDSSSVIRVKSSQTQTRKSREERWQNVSGIFKCEGNLLQNKNVLLIDDVITTGATMEACALAILQAGAKSISFAALAIAMK